MLGIGDFARIGQVSVRMLRHYDGIGLLTPARVDPWSGYRRYDAAQLTRLNRIVAFKELGFTLEQVRQILDDDLGAAELRGMLRLRRAQLAQEQAEAQARLTDVEHRLHLIEKENQMSDIEYVIKPLPARTIAGRHAEVATQPEIAGVVGPLFGQVAAAVAAAGGVPAQSVAVYDLAGESPDDGLRLTAGFDYAGVAAPGFEVVSLPAEAQAVCTVYVGPMSGIGDAWMALHLHLEQQGWTPSAPCREIYLSTEPLDDQSGWVTELQQPVVRAGG